MVMLSPLAALGALLCRYCAPAALAQITVHTATTLQQMHGFGFSQAFGRAKEFQNTPETLRQQALDYLFNTTTGAGFSIIRNRVGSGGKGDSILPTSPGSPTGTPQYEWDDDDKGQVWFSKQAMSYGVKTIYADSWSAPGFMKTSGNEATAGYLCGSTGHTCSSGDWRQAFANFLVQYVQYYAQAGIPITHLGFLNEPEFRASYSQMQISSNAQEASSFIPVLYNATRAANLSVALTCCDAEGWNMQKTFTAGLVSAGMERYLSVITSHAYTSDPTSPISTRLPTWLTEAGPSNGFTTSWGSSGANEGMAWASKIAVGVLNANLSAFLFWEGYENKQQQSGSHLIDTDGTNAVPSGIFWAFAMWSRFVRPGAYRLATTGSAGSGVLTGAFRNADGSFVLVFTNSGGAARGAKVTFDGAGVNATSAAAWLTDREHKCDSTAATFSGGTVAVTVPTRSVVTVKLS